MFKHITALAGKLRYLAPVCFGICWMFSSSASAQVQDYLDDWQWRNPLPQGNPLNSVASGNGTFVTVGASGMILTSPDRVRWTIRTSGVTTWLDGVTYANGSFVAVGQSGTVLTSTDGVNWTSRSVGTSHWLKSIIFADGSFVAVGSGGSILTSPDGVNWTSRSSGSTQWLRGVTYGNGSFVAVGGSSTNAYTILTSTDGVNWTIRADGAAGYFLHSVAYGNSGFVAVGFFGAILTSPNGVSWTSRSSGTTRSLLEVTYANSSFVAVGLGGTVLTSPDGVSWTSRTSGTTIQLNGITYANSSFVAVGHAGTILTSTDGVSWTKRSSGTFTDSLYSVIFGNGRFVAVGGFDDVVRQILTSADGVSWTSHNSGTTQTLFGVAYGNGRFVAVGDQGTILTSTVGVSWIIRSSGTTKMIRGITYDNGNFVAVGRDGTILTSPDGVSWTSRISGTTDHLNSVTFGNGSFVAVGGGGTILTSPDGMSWTIRTSGATQFLGGVTYGYGVFVAVGGVFNVGTILTSPDGVNWTSRSSGTTNPLWSVTYGNGSFVASGGIGTILSSPDGMNWISRTTGVDGFLIGVAYGNGSFVTVGSYGAILQCSSKIAELQVGRSASIDLAGWDIVSMRSLPRGLSFDAASSTLSGTPLRPGTYKVRVTRLHDGKRLNSFLTFVIEPLPAHALGNFQAVMSGELISGMPPGGSLAFRITPTGVATGQLRLADATYRWRGNIAVSGEDDATIALAINRRGQTPLLLELELANDHTLQGKVVEGAVETPVVGWRQVWHRRSNPPLPAHVGRINTLLELSGAPWVDDSAVPQGLGYAMLTSNISGGVRWLGQLADGTRLTGSTTLGPDGQLALWSSLLRNTGSILIEAGLDETAALQGAATWTRLPQANPRQRNYRNGFDAISLTLGGGRWTPPARNESVLDLPLTDPNAALTIASGGIALSATDVAQTLLTIDSRNRVTPAANDANISVRMVPKTGLVRIRFQLNDDNPENPGRNLRRTVNATAILVPGLDDNIIGGGFVLLPQLADPPTTTSRTSPILSGRIVLRKSDG